MTQQAATRKADHLTRRAVTADGRTVLYRMPRRTGDPRTTGRLESASERKRRKRAESRGHVPRRNPISRQAASSSPPWVSKAQEFQEAMDNFSKTVTLSTEEIHRLSEIMPPVQEDPTLNEYGVPVDEADPFTGEPTERESLDPRDGRCNATTAKGTRCKRKTDELYCTQHEEQNQ